MKKYLTLAFAVTVLITSLLTACDGETVYRGTPHNVVVFHSWADKGEEGEPFRQYMEEAFTNAGSQANIHHIYLDMVHNTSKDIDRMHWTAISDSISKWKPNIFLVNDDPALNWILEGNHDSIFRQIPVVFAGITCLDKSYLIDYINFTGFEDVIDLKKNLNMIEDLLSEKTTIIELDNFDEDNAIRSQLLSQIEENDSIINNSDFHILRYNSSHIDSIAPDKQCVMMVSCQDPLQNSGNGRSKIIVNAMKDIMTNAENLTFLQVKYDIYSNTLQDRSGKPMFTCIREQFNNSGERRIFGGYFTSTKTQIDEQVQYAVSILDEDMSPTLMPVSNHGKDYWIDYNTISNLYKGDDAKTSSGLKELVIDDWGSRYNIVNAPLYLKNQKYWIGSAIATLLAILIITAILTKIFKKRIKQSKQSIIQDTENQLNLRRHILSDADSSVWKTHQNYIEFPHDFAQQHKIKKHMSLKKFETFVHPDSLPNWEKIKNYRTDLGRRKYRLKLSFDNGSTWHWYDFIYNITTESSYRYELDGLIVSADETVSQTNDLEQAIREAKEVDLKETFLRNFQQTLTEPLQTVLHSSHAIVDTTTKHSQAEMADLAAQLHKGTDELIKQIDALAEKVRPAEEGTTTEQA